MTNTHAYFPGLVQALENNSGIKLIS